MVNLELVLIEMARQQGHELNGQDRLLIRTKIAKALTAKDLHRQRMEAKPYKWQKVTPPRR
ncbi:hypothetical protein POH93_10925 [Phytobacter diazotrophicus]|uniref:hypothetical protein n=1 Tax=Enterobacteriaceae TaxID=543 RepID=UPI000DE61A2B|nr:MULTISPECIES: hypothetical protein [Enterobacteriaceae]MCL5499342.1 hypothetical protein [Escherichia coli]MDC0725902.1 hypothetical protein [Phytobacter diazotrophicus]MDC0733265.1 hypothetical protein [Phytobacter diazotrophicus]SSH11798.1 Uncharacterised protein [Klebsiella pneumoniae]